MRENWRPAQAPLQPLRGSVERMAAQAFGARVTSFEPVRGGLVNANFRVGLAGAPAPPAALLRYWRRGREPAQKEIALLAHLNGRLPVPAVLATGDADPDYGLAYAFLQWIEGEELGVVAPERAPGERAALGREVGENLARVHAVSFERQGFFGADLIPRGAFDTDAQGLLDWIAAQLREGPGAERLGGRLVEALLTFVAREGGALSSPWARKPCLSHSDFDASNILVRRQLNGWRVTAILDWEFAFAGGPSVDFGHLLRPPLGDDENFIAAVAAGYRAAGGDLPGDWRAAARLADLLSWVDFAAQPAWGPEVVASARVMIARLIAR